MSSKQLTIPGMECPILPKPKKSAKQDRLNKLEQRATYLEADLALLSAQLDRDKDHGQALP